MIPTIMSYNSASYGVRSSNDLVTISAACSEGIKINTTLGCKEGESICMAEYRGNCKLPYLSGLCDLIMSLFVIVGVYITKYIEQNWEDQLNDSVQSASDYSIIVEDPEVDADNPDVWESFFSQFGQVRYVAIVRKNLLICKLVTKKHRITRKLLEFGKISTLNSTGRASEQSWLQRYEDINQELVQAYEKVYPVCKVFVTFELESSQRKCLSSLEVPDIYAMLNLKTDLPEEYIFKQPGSTKGNLLNVCRAVEPDDIKWEFIETDAWRRYLVEFVGLLMVVSSMVATYFIIIYTKKVSTYLLSGAIAVLDACFASLYESLTDWSAPKTEAGKQSSLQMKLFVARILMSTVFPYILSSWDVFLDVTFISDIINIQLSACFLSPLLNLLDIGGVVQRNIVAPLTAQTQAELNGKWSGTPWCLAERYTVVTKIIFISLFYAVLSPISLVIGAASFVLLFLVDRYLLLRKWSPVGLLDTSGKEHLNLNE